MVDPVNLPDKLMKTRIANCVAFYFNVVNHKFFWGLTIRESNAV